MSAAVLDHLVSAYVIFILYNNSIVHLEPHNSIDEAESVAVSLANEWHNKDGIAKYGKYQLETIEEVKDYYRSDAYFDSGDAAHICIEEIYSSSQVIY